MIWMSLYLLPNPTSLGSLKLALSFLNDIFKNCLTNGSSLFKDPVNGVNLTHPKMFEPEFNNILIRALLDKLFPFPINQSAISLSLTF